MTRFVALIALLLACEVFLRSDEPATQPQWTTSRVKGTPEPPAPYRCAVAFPKLKFDHPLVIRAQGSRFFVGEQRGRIYSFENKPDATAELFVDLKKELKSITKHPGARDFFEFYGIAFHPKFESNRECFLCYTLTGRKGEKTGVFQHDKNLPDGTRLSRFKVKPGAVPKLDVDSEEILLSWLQGGHNAGDLHFGPDGMLYISTGDATDPNPPDLFRTGQDITDLLSSILRIDVDHRDAGLNYSIPKDNPFVGKTQFHKPCRGEVWAFGFRNPWRMSFDRATGDLFTGDVGWEAWEMVHKVTRGSNHGWSLMESRQQVNTKWPAGTGVITPPVIELDHSIAASVTGGHVYRGRKHPELVGKYVFGDWSSRRMWAAKLDGEHLQTLDELTDPAVRVVAFGEDAAGELYFLDYDTGLVHEIAKNDTAAFDPKQFPRTLSATGLFTSVIDDTPAAGVLPFEIHAAMWQDGTTAKRWIALPNGGKVIDNDERRTIPGDVDWHKYKYHFPKDTVLVKTIALPDGTRIETQLLHFDGIDWHGYSYQWRAEQNDADLVAADGAEQRYRIADARVDGGQRELNWQFASRTQCLQCHNFWSEYALGFSEPQLNKVVSIEGSKINQLVHFAQCGVMTRADKAGKTKGVHTAESVKPLKAMMDPMATSPEIAKRARSYLHANCSHCHRFGGGGAVEFELIHDRNLDHAKIFESPTRGHFDIADARVIAKGDPKRSVLYYRMAKFGGGRMPHLSSEWPDEAGLALIHDWISQMPGDAQPMATGEIAEQLKSLRGGMELAKQATCDCTTAEEREAIFAEARKLPAGLVRDLFEGFITKPGGERKLGANPKPKAVLSLMGDIGRGKELFKHAKLQCMTCHKLDGEGKQIGPELDKVLGKRSRSDVLDSILEPSRRVAAEFQAYVMKLDSGRVVTGLLVKRDDTAVTLKTAEGVDVTAKASEIESLEVSRQSLMPAGLIADLTPQQAADLLTFVMTLGRSK
jgi:putative heme-binding domain-containing protein